MNKAALIAYMAIAVRFSVTVVLLLFVFFHAFGLLSLDLVDIAIFGIIALLWLAPSVAKYFDTVEFGGAKFTFSKQLKEVQAKIEIADLKADPSKTTKPSYLQIAPTDPNLAFAGLRIELEKQLRSLAEERNLLASDQRNRPLSLSQLVDRLYQEKVISLLERSALNDLISLGNRAAHGIEVDESAAPWAFEVGPQIIAALEKKHLSTNNS
jgi:hypothetical protein